MRFRITKARVELDDFRAVSCQDKTSVKDTSVGTTFFDHAFKNRLDNSVNRCVNHALWQVRNWRIGTHPTSVRSLVTIISTFVVLGRWHNVELVPIDKGKDRELFPVQEFLDDHTRT